MLAGMNLNEVPKGGDNNKTIAGTEGGSDVGKRKGELADYQEQIRSKIRRKIIFDYNKVIGNPIVEFTVKRVNGSLNKIILKKSSGNNKWDTAVRDAIQRSVPLPEPTDDTMLPCKKDGLTLNLDHEIEIDIKYPPLTQFNLRCSGISLKSEGMKLRSLVCLFLYFFLHSFRPLYAQSLSIEITGVGQTQVPIAWLHSLSKLVMNTSSEKS